MEGALVVLALLLLLHSGSPWALSMSNNCPPPGSHMAVVLVLELELRLGLGWLMEHRVWSPPLLWVGRATMRGRWWREPCTSRSGWT